MSISQYQKKETQYFSNIRRDVMSLIPKNGVESILEIGAGGCDTLLAIKQENLAQKVTAIELMTLENSNQTNLLIDELIIGDIEDETTFLKLGNQKFDIIIVADILEHIVNPWSVLKSISKYSKVNGKIIISLPNIQHYKALIKIFVLGDFRYDPQGGVLDKTHLRFFCKKNMLELANLQNFEVESCTPSFALIKSNPAKLFNKITFSLFENYLANQFVICIKN